MAYIGDVSRWDLVQVDLEPSVGREQGGETRPALVVSNDGFNRSFGVVTIIPLTKQKGKRRKVYAFEVPLPARAAGNPVDSIVMPQQTRTIAKERVLDRIGTLADATIRQEIEDRLLDHLGISFELD